MSTSLFTKENSSVEHADGCPAFFEMTAIGFTNRLYNTILPSYKIGISYFKEGEVDYISLIDDQQKVGKKVINEFIKNNRIILSLYKKWLKNYNLMMNNYYQLFNKDLSKLDNEELVKHSNYLTDLYKNKISMPGFIDGFMFYADKRFVFLMENFCKEKNINDCIKLSSILISLAESSFINEEENNLQQIANQIKKKKNKSLSNLQRFLKNHENFDVLKQIKDHLFKYSWIKSNYYGYTEYSFADAINGIKIIIKSNKDEKNNFKKNKIEKEKIIKKYKFNKEILAIIQLSDILVKWQDLRKVYTLTFVSLKQKLLEEISLRAKIDLGLLRYSISNEIESILSNKFNKNELMKRQSGCLFIHSNGVLKEIISGNKANKFKRAISMAEQKENIEELKGITASIGKARGVVKIVISVKQIDKVKDGDVLVSPMTRPEHIIGMKKAAAIITDDGGITCHAAIVSRELGIPCIIGTKIATKVLKDGDLVEVDANKGVIKILK